MATLRAMVWGFMTIVTFVLMMSITAGVRITPAENGCERLELTSLGGHIRHLDMVECGDVRIGQMLRSGLQKLYQPVLEGM